MGDFNNVLRATNRIGGRIVTEAEFVDLANMMEAVGLAEMDSMGDFYTWSNKQVDNIIYFRIDSVLGNVEWFTKYDDLTLTVKPPSISDHAILHLKSMTQNIQHKRYLKFRNCITHLEGYHRVVEISWNKCYT